MCRQPLVAFRDISIEGHHTVYFQERNEQTAACRKLFSAMITESIESTKTHPMDRR